MQKFTIVQKNKARGDKSWYGRIFDTDTKAVRYVSLGTTFKRVAEEWLRRKIAEEVTGVRTDGENVPISRAINDFLDSLDGSPITEANYRSAFSRLSVMCADNDVYTLKDLTPVKCSTMFSQISDIIPSTKRKRLTMYRTWVKWCFTAYEITNRQNPFAIVKVTKAAKPVRDFWTMEQIGQILDATSSADERLLYALMAFAGLRIQEALHLRWESLAGGRIRFVGKGGKDADLPIGTRLKNELERHGTKESGKIFRWKSTVCIDKKIKRTMEDAGLDFGGLAHCHRFRHSFASNLIRAGVNIKVVQTLMRHESITITLNTYAHLLSSDIDNAIDAL